MRRLLVLCLVLAAGAAVATTALGADGGDSGHDPGTYTIELDNAFGLTQGADVKVAGVRAGKVTGMRVDPKTTHALIDIQLSQPGFESLRADAFCETRPQSLIGEYFVDCLPGKSSRTLPAGARIPIQHTASTIPADLLGDVMRLPYRQRLRIIIDELGAGVGGRGGDINQAIRRAVPALRETDKVLEILGRQNQTLKQLTGDADTVIGDLSANRHNVGRFVTQAKQTAQTSAERQASIRAGLQKLPTFLAELTPTMKALGQSADANTPALQNLNAASGQLTRLFKNTPRFAQASQVGLRTLADASRAGKPALKASEPLIRQLATTTVHLPELANNLAIVFEHLGNRRFAVEKDPRSPGGQGYTGWEAILQYIFDQTMATNIFDANTHILKVNLFTSKCSQYQNLESLKQQMKVDPTVFKDCAAELGPHLPGITQRDPTATPGGSSAHATHPSPPSPPSLPSLPGLPVLRAGKGSAADKKAAARSKGADQRLRKRIEQALGINLPAAQPPQSALGSEPATTGPNAVQNAAPKNSPDPQQLLDFLLGP
jgi:phospholipid/cholesterol/gamma-HCH transport system substrate-binding protein